MVGDVYDDDDADADHHTKDDVKIKCWYFKVYFNVAQQMTFQVDRSYYSHGYRYTASTSQSDG